MCDALMNAIANAEDGVPAGGVGLRDRAIAGIAGSNFNRDIQLPGNVQSAALCDGRLHRRFDFAEFVGRSPKMIQVYDRIRRAASVDSTVLILGESGTGKELVARALHRCGLRKDGPFVAVDCTAVPHALVESELFGHVRGAFTGAVDQRIGRFEQANGGTLLIDEIGNFELRLQAKLLRVLETLTVTPVGGSEQLKTDVRLVAATNGDLHEMVRRGTFRQDLLYRLDVVTIVLPPLRDRPGDVPLLVRYFMDFLVARKRMRSRTVSPRLMQRLIAYQWPGNVRELSNAVESMMVMADGETLIERDLPEPIALGMEYSFISPGPDPIPVSGDLS